MENLGSGTKRQNEPNPKNDDDEYHKQIQVLKSSSPKGQNSPITETDETGSLKKLSGEKGNHLHIGPGKEYWLSGPENGSTKKTVHVEIAPKYSNRFVIFISPQEKLHLQMTSSVSDEACVSIYCMNDKYHRLIVDQRDRFYLVGIPRHKYIIQTVDEDWTLSPFKYELHPGAHLELDIDDYHSYFISVPLPLKHVEPNSALLLVNNESKIQSKA